MRPGNGILKFALHARLMDPEFILGHHNNRAHNPDTRFALLDLNLMAGIFLAKRNLTARPHDLDAGFGFKRVHIHAGFVLVIK
ncbi:hypothetical protein WK32_31550 [Burkholderia vietnamiensis]|nr:hypothetical protein WK32_31550 [Burkholderia vietnamiensis]